LFRSFITHFLTNIEKHMTTAFLFDPRFLEHDTGRGHPERPDRLRATMVHLRKQAFFDSLTPVHAEVCDLDWIHRIHHPALSERAQAACRERAPYLDTPDVALSGASYDVALLAAGGLLNVLDEVVAGNADNGFALVRPPGHHAEYNNALGFCIFNNIAIAARYLQQQHGLERILILDWDVHHGNGTQHAFESDPSIFFTSLHQYPHYPGTGNRSEAGEGRGKGATLNCPMPAGAGDMDYTEAFSEKILPAIDRFMPDAILISAGFDAHQSDPLGAINLSTDFYGWMTERMLEMADKHCAGRLVSVLEGGYNLDALASSIAVHLRALLKTASG
jgi:acetoin utilization deacetylase AcuC-like enzyme